MPPISRLLLRTEIITHYLKSEIVGGIEIYQHLSAWTDAGQSRSFGKVHCHVHVIGSKWGMWKLVL